MKVQQLKVLSQAMGPYQTNCYIVVNSGKEIIIDPGMGAFEWIKTHVKSPVAILNTHGHSDHIWSNKVVQEFFNIPLFCPIDDAFMLINDFEKEGYELSTPNIKVKDSECFNIAGLDVHFLHFPGHTPGCSAIQIGKTFFSGDFIFKGSIGRVDFPFSSPKEMYKSIEKFLKIKEDFVIYPGHGPSTTVKAEQCTLQHRLKYL